MHGVGALSDAELLAMLLRKEGRKQDVLALSNCLISEAGSPSGLLTCPGRFSTPRRYRACENPPTAHRDGGRAPNPYTEQGISPTFNDPELVFRYFQPLATGLEVEKFWILCLNRKSRLIRRLRPLRTLPAAVSSIPAAIPPPSTSGIKVTRQLQEAFKAVDITLHNSMPHILREL